MEFTFDSTFDMTDFKALEKRVKTLNKRHIRFGWYEGKFYPASGGNSGVSIAQVAYWQEYGMAGVAGKKGIPSRPYFRQAINKIKRSTRGDITSVFLTALNGGDTSAKLSSMASSFVVDYHSSVMRQNYTKLAAYTIAKKGHAYQMVDSTIMATNFKARVYHQSQDNIKDS